MTPLISVIVPVYNVVDYLGKCVNSILVQSYTRFELIIVDDGSRDGSEVLCDKLASTDSRIICIHKKNGGLSSARNAALDVCKGEYITFVDSDDMISPDALEVLLKSALKNKSEAVITDGFILFSENFLIPKSSLVKGDKTLDNITALQDILCRSTRWEACGHLFKSSLWENVRFPKGRIYEDLATIPYIVSKTNKVTILNTAIYYYFQRQGSIMRHSENKVSLDLCYISQNLIDYFKREVKDKPALANICSGILMELCSRTDFAAKNISTNHEFIISARKILKRNLNQVLRSSYYSIKQKIYYSLESFGLHRLIYCIHRQ